MSLRGVCIGQLDRRLQFENIVVTVDPIGNTPVETFTTAFTLFGKKITKSGGEVFESDQQVAVQNCEVMVRYTNLITTQMRFLDLTDQEYYTISDIQKNKREGYCLIQAKRRDNA